MSKGIKLGDIVLCPDGSGTYHVGEISSNYFYHPGGILPHRRNVKWMAKHVEREAMSDMLKKSTGSIGTVSNITGYAQELESLIVSIAIGFEPRAQLFLECVKNARGRLPRWVYRLDHLRLLQPPGGGVARDAKLTASLSDGDLVAKDKSA